MIDGVSVDGVSVYTAGDNMVIIAGDIEAKT